MCAEIYMLEGRYGNESVMHIFWIIYIRILELCYPTAPRHSRYQAESLTISRKDIGYSLLTYVFVPCYQPSLQNSPPSIIFKSVDSKFCFSPRNR